MKRFLKILLILLLCGVFFLLGWRVMPRVWPSIKQNVYYRIFPTPVPQTTPVPDYAYFPEGTAAFDDPIGPTDSLIYYFYREACGHCVSMKPFIEGIPDEITLPDGTVSAVKFIPINSRDEQLRPTVLKTYADFGVPEDEVQVPAMIIGDRCIMMPTDIWRYFYEALLSGEGLGTPLLNGGTRTVDGEASSPATATPTGNH